MRKVLILIILVALMLLVVIGCEIDREVFEENIGTSFPFEMSIRMGADGTGILAFGEDFDDEYIPVQFKDGRIWGSGEGVSLDANVTEENGKYIMKGTITLIGLDFQVECAIVMTKQ